MIPTRRGARPAVECWSVMRRDTADFRYPATYTDARGSERTVIANDSDTLRVRLRGVDFTGRDFDALSPMEGANPEQLRQFTLHQGDLCSCRIGCQIPVPIAGRVETSGILLADLVLGDPAPNGGIDRKELRLVLEFDGHTFSSPGTSGWFEDELLAIQSQLPEGVFVKACINCLYSDYSPYGHGLFGCMMCFRNIKSEYVKVTTKEEFWSVHDRPDRMSRKPICVQRLSGASRAPATVARFPHNRPLKLTAAVYFSCGRASRVRRRGRHWPRVMPLDFLATESGFDNGLGGASNAAGVGEQHYVLFGKDGDGIYFEYDDQIHGGIGQVAHVSIHSDHVVFRLHDLNTITVRRKTEDAPWSEFIAGIRRTFPPAIVAGA